MRSASNRVRRARPSLGTFVEITARGDSEAKLHGAIDHAFDAIARVDRQMSFHHPASDISRINREAFSAQSEGRSLDMARLASGTGIVA